jgi:hypothetical protein
MLTPVRACVFVHAGALVCGWGVEPFRSALVNGSPTGAPVPPAITPTMVLRTATQSESRRPKKYWSAEETQKLIDGVAKVRRTYMHTGTGTGPCLQWGRAGTVSQAGPPRLPLTRPRMACAAARPARPPCLPAHTMGVCLSVRDLGGSMAWASGSTFWTTRRLRGTQPAPTWT